MILVPLLLLASTLHPGPERPITPPLPDAAPYSQTVTSVAAGDQTALVVWEEAVGQFAAARIDRDGVRLDERPIPLAAGGEAARGHDRWLVAGSRERTIVGQFVGDDGIAGEAFTIGEVDDRAEVEIAFDGTSYLVVWNTRYAFHAALIDASGSIAGPFSFQAPVEYQELDVAALDGGFAVVTLHHDYSHREYTMEVFRLDANATLVSYGWLDRTSTASLSDLHAIADGNRIVAAWTSVRGPAPEVFVAREGQPLRIAATNRRALGITSVGGAIYIAVRDSLSTVALISEDGTQERPWPRPSLSLAAGSFGDRALLVGTSMPSDTDLFTSIVDASLRELTPVEQLALEPALQERPSIARAANGRSLVVWIESGRGNGAAVAGMRIDAAGRPLDTRPLVIDAGIPHVEGMAGPRVASDGEGWLVVWNTGGEIRSRRVQGDGTVTGAPAFVASTYRTAEVCVAWNGSEYVAGYAGSTNTYPPRTAPLLVPISRDNVRGAAMPLSDDRLGTSGGVVCAAAGTDVLFAWESGATIVRGDGTSIGPLPLENVTAVASDGERFAVAREIYSDLENHYELERAVVSRHGTVSYVAEPRIDGRNPALAASRDGFVLAWEDDGDLYALALDKEGRATGGPVALAATAQEPALAGGDSVTAVYQRDLGSELLPRWRVFAKALGESAPARRRAVRH